MSSPEIEGDLVGCRHFDVSICSVEFEGALDALFGLLYLPVFSVRCHSMQLLHGAEPLNSGPHLSVHGLFYVDSLLRLISVTLFSGARVDRHRAVLLGAYSVSIYGRFELAQLVDAILEHFLSREQPCALLAGLRRCA